MKKQTIGKVAIWTVYLFLAGAVGALTSRFAMGWYGWVLLGAALLALVAVFEWVNKKLWPKADVDSQAKEKEPRIKWVIRTILAMVMGASFVGGMLHIIFALIQGQEGGFLLYIGFVALSIVCLIVLITARPVQDQEMKAEVAEMKREFKLYNKDERLHVIGNKVGNICFGAAMLLLLIFGALIAVFPPENPNIVPLSVLGIVGLAAILYTVLVIYEHEKSDAESPKLIRSHVCWLLFSLIPSLLMGIRWVTAGLTSMGIAFFSALVLASILSVVNLWYARKYR